MKIECELICNMCFRTFMVCQNCHEFAALGKAFVVCLNCASPEEAPPLIEQGKQPCAVFPIVDTPYHYCWCVGEEKPDASWPFNIREPYPGLVSALRQDRNYDCPTKIWRDLLSGHSFPKIGTVRAKWELR